MTATNNINENKSCSNPAQQGSITKSTAELHEELRNRILCLSGVSERPDAGIHEDAFFVERTMFMHIHGHDHCNIRLSKADQRRVLAEGKARPHCWVPEAGYVTFNVAREQDLEPVMDLVLISHQHFIGGQNPPRVETNGRSGNRDAGALGRNERGLAQSGAVE